ncbi:MAG: NAD(P)/FAD-dependent oxidoreductase [Burkholderiales bacterium]|nr:NAD(P)/FAD-dependent oxidoreductase [Burkholderiales bacterium]
MTSTRGDDGNALDLLIVGAGFAGMYMLFKARELGFRARVIEAGDDVGGTWYWNRYPGARCDIESLEYSYGFDEALQQEWRWSERFAAQPEILAYARHVAARFDLRRDITFGARVTRAWFDDAASTWEVGTDGGQALRARFVVMATGCLSSANLPAIPGIETFGGPRYHTGQWPHEPVDFSGLRVGVIGTGSSAVQSIPVIARQARELTVFQRTATYSVPAHNAPLDPAYEARVKADYAGFRRRNERMPAAFGANLDANDASALEATPAERQRRFDERWRAGGLGFTRAFGDIVLDARANALAAAYVRDKIRALVRDAATAALLSPSQPVACKRLCVDTGYYETFNLPHVRLVDIAATGIEAVTPRGVRAAGREFALDALVFATGFDAMTGTLLRMDIRGRGGLPLAEKWRAGPLNYLGLMVAGFPNLFTITGPGSPSVLTNMIVSIEQHVRWIGACLAWLRAHGRSRIEAREAAERDWVGHVNGVASRTIFPGCNSWYLGANVPGKVRVFMPLLGFPAYADKCAAVAAAGYEGFAVA